MACEAMPMRPPSSAIIATRKPWFSSPRRASSGIRQSSKVSGTVSEARRPSLSSCLPGLRPGVPPSTRKVEMPRVPGPPVRAHTTITPAREPLVIHCFCPRSRHPPGTRSAVVRMEPGSLPASGSLRAKAPQRCSPEVSRGTWRCRCASEPKRAMTSATMLVTAMVTAVDAQARAISVIASEYATTPASAPPRAAGMLTPISPSSARPWTISVGKRSSRSSWAATGRMTRSAKDRAVVTMSCCVSEISRSMTRRTLADRGGYIQVCVRSQVVPAAVTVIWYCVHVPVTPAARYTRRKYGLL